MAGSQIWAVGRLTGLGDVMLCQRSLHESCRMGRRIVVMKLICSLGHCECDGHTLHKVSQQRVTADWLGLRESDWSRMRSKVTSDWLSCYIQATRSVLEIFKVAGYFPDSPHRCRRLTSVLWLLITFCFVSGKFNASCVSRRAVSPAVLHPEHGDRDMCVDILLLTLEI